MNAAKEYGVDKYIQISTDEVYGTLGKTGYFTETTPLQPNSPYSASKAGGDLITRAYFEFCLNRLHNACHDPNGQLRIQLMTRPCPRFQVLA